MLSHSPRSEWTASFVQCSLPFSTNPDVLSFFLTANEYISPTFIRSLAQELAGEPRSMMAEHRFWLLVGAIVIGALDYMLRSVSKRRRCHLRKRLCFRLDRRMAGISRRRSLPLPTRAQYISFRISCRDHRSRLERDRLEGVDDVRQLAGAARGISQSRMIE